MKFIAMSPGAALAALFLVSGCGRTTPHDTAAGAAEKSTALAAAEVPRPPAIPDEATDAQAAPLNDAGEIASEISSNTMISQVPVRGGLAWVEDGQVVRTASRDGQRVAYFHPGEDEPFLVQRAGLAFAVRDGEAQIVYDSEGRPLPVSNAARAEAARLADQSRREQQVAEQGPAPVNHGE
jgi:hypothetical protein